MNSEKLQSKQDLVKQKPGQQSTLEKFELFIWAR